MFLLELIDTDDEEVLPKRKWKRNLRSSTNKIETSIIEIESSDDESSLPNLVRGCKFMPNWYVLL